MNARLGRLCLIPVCLCFSSVLLAQVVPGKAQDPAVSKAVADAIKSAKEAKQFAIEAQKSADQAKASALEVHTETPPSDKKKAASKPRDPMMRPSPPSDPGGDGWVMRPVRPAGSGKEASVKTGSAATGTQATGGGAQEGLDDPCKRNPNLPHCKGA